MNKIGLRWIVLTAATVGGPLPLWLMLQPFIEVLMWAVVWSGLLSDS